MKVVKALLYCLLGFTLAFLLMFLVVNKQYKDYKNIPTVTLNVGTGDSENNKLPTLETLSLSFPGDESMYDCVNPSSNTTVKVTAVNPTDEDGMISKLVFYYYNIDDPSRILDYKESLITTPYTYFAIPNGGYEYRFGVILYDNNGGVVDSDDIIGKGPTFYSPSCIDAPIVTLRLSSTDIEVGDTIKYAVIARTALKDDNFENNRKFYYDFTGDGEWDLVTGNHVVEYTFTEGYPYGVRPRVAVEYKGKIGIGEGANIYVSGYDNSKNINEGIENKLSEYEINKMDILALIPNTSNIRGEVKEGFLQFEESSSSEERGKILNDIMSNVLNNGNLDLIDVSMVQGYFCSIFEYYNLLSYTNVCG